MPGISDFELGELRKMIAENVERLDEVDTREVDANEKNEEAHLNLHIQMDGNKTSISHICKLNIFNNYNRKR